MFGLSDDARNCSLESRSEPFVSVEEQDPFGFEGKGPEHPASSESRRSIGNSEPSHPPAVAISTVLSVRVESTTTISAKPSSVARHSGKFTASFLTGTTTVTGNFVMRSPYRSTHASR
jgi:hypothetical protein